MLKNDEVIWVDTPHRIEVLFQDYFKKLFIPATGATLDNTQHSLDIDLVLQELHLPQISNIDSNMLLAPITNEEIQDAMFHIANDKSPRLDGFPSMFFKIHWECVGPSITQTVQCFFSTRYLLK